MQCCDCIFTPIVDRKFREHEMPSNPNYFTDYPSPLYRVEMLYAANIPVLENDISTTDVKRHTLFESGLAYHCSQNRRPHFLFGHLEWISNTTPIMLPPLQHSYLTNYHPLKGNLSVASDVKHIENLLAELEPYMKVVTVGYSGDMNESGERQNGI